jgi:carboxymethylenebutenolidase
MPYLDITKPPAPLPSARLQIQKPGLSLQPPLSRLGSGPGVILLTDVYDEQTQSGENPSAVLKWGEEGFTVVQIDAAAVRPSDIANVLAEAIQALESCEA